MLHAEYLKLPRFPIPPQVSDARVHVQTSFGSVTIYRFDEGHIGLWWNPHGALHDRMLQIIEAHAVWNAEGKAWQVSAENAGFVLDQIWAL